LLSRGRNVEPDDMSLEFSLSWERDAGALKAVLASYTQVCQ
jgi:hypothetical protein